MRYQWLGESVDTPSSIYFIFSLYPCCGLTCLSCRLESKSATSQKATSPSTSAIQSTAATLNNTSSPPLTAQNLAKVDQHTQSAKRSIDHILKYNTSNPASQHGTVKNADDHTRETKSFLDAFDTFMAS
jgi:hypothetical protein